MSSQTEIEMGSPTAEALREKFGIAVKAKDLNAAALLIRDGVDILPFILDRPTMLAVENISRHRTTLGAAETDRRIASRIIWPMI
jgi:hypothetical protein